MKEAPYMDRFDGATADREIIISRVLNAPRELVWEAWTNPQHLVNWFGPKGFTNTFYEADIRTGGKWRFMMHGPDGRNYPNVVLFSEVLKPKRLVYFQGSDEDNFPNFKATVIFEELEGKTKLTMLSVFPTTDEKEFAVREICAVEGGNETLDKLELYIKSRMELRKEAKTSKSARVSTYLNFRNETEQAFLFYRSVFGTEFSGRGVHRFGDVAPPEGMPPLSEQDKKLILHIELPILGGHVLMGTDAPESFGFQLTGGNRFHINLEPESREETKRLFDALAEGGQITMPLQDMFWGAYYGSCTDRFGVNWMVNYTDPE